MVAEAEFSDADVNASLEKQATLLIKAGRHVDAAELLKTVNCSQDTAARVNGTIALCYFRGEQYENAIPYFQRSLDAEKHFGRLIQLGQSCLFTRKFSEAAAIFTEAAERDDDPVRSLVWLARTFLDAGDVERAREIIYAIASEHLSWNLPREQQIPFSHYPYFLQWVPGWRKLLEGLEVHYALEIGSMEGLSSIWIADQLVGDDGLLYCNDLQFRPEFRSNVSAAGLKRPPILVEGSSEFALTNLKNGAFDFVYVDGDHRPGAVFQDGMNAIRCARPGGVVIFDDYLNRRNKTQESVDVLLALVGNSGEIISRGRQVAFRRNSETAFNLEAESANAGAVDWKSWQQEDLRKLNSEDLLEYLSRNGREVFSQCVQLR